PPCGPTTAAKHASTAVACTVPRSERRIATSLRGAAVDSRSATTSACSATGGPSPVPDRPLFPARRTHLDRMTGPVGIRQHARGVDPDKGFGTCTDDV